MHARRRAASRIVLWFALAAPSAVLAARLPPGFQESIELSGLSFPTAVRFASDGRIFVAEKSGIIKVFAGLGDTAPAVFADLRTQVHNFADRGLLGLALHPQFPATPYVYVLYALDAEIGGAPPRWGAPGQDSDGCPTPPGDDGCVVGGRLSRLEASGNQSTGETVLLENWCQQFTSHSVGGLLFAPDGSLLVSGGEGASFNVTEWGQFGFPQPNPCGDPPTGFGIAPEPSTSLGGALRSQNLGLAGYGRATFGGKVLRVDPNGNAAGGNPLAGSAVPGADRIIAAGFRNPLRFAIRPGTNEIWVGDVGWFNWEEINRIVPSGNVINFGWPCYEGNAPQSGWQALNSGVCRTLYDAAGSPAGAVQPWFTYSHFESVAPGDGCSMDQASISGMAFYAGGTYPASYDNALFFADYSRGCIWNMFAGPGGLPDPSTRQLFVGDASGPVDLQIGPGGDLFYADIAQGTLRRIKFFSANQPPLASLTADATSGPAPLTVHFNAAGSSDPEGGALTFSWDFDGNGTFGDDGAAGATPTFVYPAPGTFQARVRVTDPEGADSTASVTISAGNDPPAVTISAPTPPLNFAIGDEIHFSGSAVDPQQGALPPSAMTWTLTVHHCPAPDSCHEHPVQDLPGIASGQFIAPDHEQPSFLELTLKATDAGGLSGEASVELLPRTMTLSIGTVPSGLTIGVGEAGQPTPFQRTLAVGSRTLVSAPTPQLLDGVTYTFVSWSDGGAAAHDLVAVDGGMNLVATFSRGCETSADCDDGNACTDDACVDTTCVSTPRGCSPVDECHPTGGCDATTGQCVSQPLDLEGARCVCRTMLDGMCDEDDALPPNLRRVLLKRLTKACELLDAVTPENPPRKKSAALRRLVRRLTHRVTVTAAERIREPCRTALGQRLKEVQEVVKSLQPSKKKKGGKR